MSGATSANFTYDGDGTLVKSVLNGVTTYDVGNHFEWTGDTTSMVKYDYAGSQRVAMRWGNTGTLSFLLGDHLGSTSLTANSSGGKVAELRYHPWGGTRFTSGTTPTSYQYTGQRNDAATYPAFGLYFYNYDPNGNMTLRVEVSGTQRITYTQAFDIESRLTAVTNTVNGATTTFTYDGDGALVKKTVGITTTYYVGPHYEKLVSTNIVTATKYYFFGSQRVAMRVCTGANGSRGTNGATSTLSYLHGDHLGSASLSTDASGGKTAEMRYYPYGETRSGSMTTDRQYTGQRREIGLGLYDYNARYYDPLLGRFLSADSIVPSPANPQTLNRYAYVLNNPMKYRDPDGHNPLPFLIVLAAAAVVRVGSEYAVSRVPWMDRARRDQLGGGLVTDVADEIERESALHSVDATLVSAVLRHESAAVERRALTIWPIFQPNIIANAAEGVQSLLPTGWSMSNLRFGEMASLGPGQMQLRRARELEELGYVTPRNGDGARRAALLGRETSVEYVAGMLHYLSDQLSTVEGFSTLSVEQQHRLILIGYVWGWTDQFQTLLHEKGLAWMIENGGYDKTTLDEYLRWSSGQ